MSNKILLICEDQIIRQLLISKINTIKNCSLIGSCGYDKNIIRFCKIYKPDNVILYNFDKNKHNAISSIYKIKKESPSTIISMIDGDINNRDILLYLRYGVSHIFSDKDDIETIIKYSTTVSSGSFFPINLINKLNILPEVKSNGVSRSGPLIKLLSMYASFGTNLRFLQYKNKFIYKFTKKNKKYVSSLLNSLVKSGFLPKKPNNLVNYLMLFPELNYKFSIDVPNLGKKDFIIIFMTQNYRKKLEKIVKNPKNWEFFDKNKPIFNDFFYNSDLTKILFGDDKNGNFSLKVVKNTQK